MNYKITYSEYFKPKEKISVFFYYLLLVGAGVAIITLSARLIIPLPFTPVPVTAQTLSILFLGALYGKKMAGITTSVYLILGIIGFPLFQNGNNGFSYLISSSTSGYLMGFIVASYVVGFLSEKGYDKKIFTSLFSMIIGSLIIYFFGLIWLSKFVEMNQLFQLGFLPFIVGDLFKILLATSLLPLGWKIINKMKKGV